MSEDQLLKSFYIDAHKRAEQILSEPHVGADVKSTLKDLLKIAEDFRHLLDHTSGQSADIRVMRKRFEAQRNEIRQQEERVEEVKRMVLMLATEVEVIQNEAGQIIKRASTPNDPIASHATRIKTSAQKVVEVVMSLVKSLKPIKINSES